MSELREYIQHKYNCNISSYGEEVMDDGITVPCSCGLAQALEAPSEMQQLVEWLEESLERVTELSKIYSVSARYPHRAELYKDILNHIRTKFLGGGNEPLSL